MNSKNQTKLKLILSIISILILSSINTGSADGGSIANVKYYPEDGGFYDSVDCFVEQVTAINSNTTVWVSIDNQLLIQLSYQGLINEYKEEENATVEWHTWKIEVDPIVSSGIHTFQFFKQYQVWQKEDNYWADFYAHSEVKTFKITEPPTQSKENEINDAESNYYSNYEILDFSDSLEISEKRENDYSKIEEFSQILPNTTMIMLYFISLISFLKKINMIN